MPAGLILSEAAVEAMSCSSYKVGVTRTFDLKLVSLKQEPDRISVATFCRLQSLATATDHKSFLQDFDSKPGPRSLSPIRKASYPKFGTIPWRSSPL